MAMIYLQERVVENKEWAIILFLLAFSLVAVVRSLFEIRFNDFLNLIISDKYIKLYRESANLLSWFNLLLFIVQLLSFSFLIQLLLSHLGFCSKFDYIVFIRIYTLLNVFILSKFLIEKIIAATFDIEEFVEQFNLYKLSYRAYFGMLLLPFNIILYFNENIDVLLIYIVSTLIFSFNVIVYLKSLKIYQNLLQSYLFYIILYLCTLEFAPYYFVYYWFIKR